MVFQYFSRKVIEDMRSELESLISTKQGSQMEADWQALISTSEDWAQQLDLAEARVVHLDTALTDLDLQVCKVEREQAGWALPPQSRYCGDRGRGVGAGDRGSFWVGGAGSED